LGAHHTHDALYASGLSFEGEVSTAEEQLLLARETERMRGKALEHTQDHVTVNQLIPRRILTERLAHAHLQQHTTETARDAHAPARESDKVLGWLPSSVSASLHASVSASQHASHDADANDNTHPHDATDSRDSQQWQQHLTADLGIGASLERAREGGGGGRERRGGRGGGLTSDSSAALEGLYLNYISPRREGGLSNRGGGERVFA